MTEEREIKYPQKRISIKDDVYRELKIQAKREKCSVNYLAQQIFEDHLATCQQQG